MLYLSTIKDKIINGSGLFTFIRSSMSSQVASWIDMGTRFIFFSFILRGLAPFYRSNLSVAIGAIVGGIVNCTINYKFTFHASGQNVKGVIVKYFLVWTGSLLLNMYGTTLLQIPLRKWGRLTELGFTPDGIFAATTLIVSLIVSLAWNFLLQRNFVYRPTRFDRYAIALIDLFGGHKPTSKNNEPE